MGPGNLEECTICMEVLNCPVGTNCGHTFCAPCILRWQHQKWPDPCECPVCRRQVTLLMGAEEWNSHNTQQIFREVAEYNQQVASRQMGLLGRLQALRDAPNLYHYLRRDFMRLGGGLPFSLKTYFFFLVVIAILYLVSPLDLIPELVFGIIGLIDDVLVVVGVLMYIVEQYRVFVVNVGRQR